MPIQGQEPKDVLFKLDYIKDAYELEIKSTKIKNGYLLLTLEFVADTDSGKVRTAFQVHKAKEEASKQAAITINLRTFRRR